jgi:hypothetical protein
MAKQIPALPNSLNIRHKGHSGIRITHFPDSAFRSF